MAEGACAEQGPGTRQHTSEDELRGWMERMRGRCEVVESSPEPTAADAQWEEPQAAAPGAEQSGAEGVPARRKLGGEEDLRRWMDQRRGRCEVLESLPGAATADARSADLAAAAGGGASAVARTAGGPRASGGSSGSSHSAGRSPDAQTGEPELRRRLLSGPLPRAEREREWGRLLGRGAGECAGGAGRQGCRLPALVDLLGGDFGPGRDEDVLFEALGGTVPEGREGAGRLAALFCERHAAWVPDGGGGGGQSPDAHAFARMTQLLRYHRPVQSSALEEACRAAGHHGLGAGLSAACCSCGMPVALRDILLELPESDADLWTDADACGHTDADLMCLACDLVVLEGRQDLLLLLVVTLLSEAAVRLGSEAAVGLDEALRGALTLSLATRLSVDEIHQCVQDACAMLDSTPTTLQGVFDDAGSELPACAVAPEEVLRHTHKGAVGDWRLIVVDARMRPSTLALPVCVRLPPARHSARRGVLRDLPGDDAIHVCLVGDLAPTRGDDAFELCRYLSGPGVFRSHVSVVAGGWASLEMAAAALDLDLLPACRLEDEEGESRDAAAAVADVVGHVADVTGRVSGAAQQAVQTAWAEAPPLGPAVAGARVAATEAAGQAAEAAGRASEVGRQAARRVWAGAGGFASALGSLLLAADDDDDCGGEEADGAAAPGGRAAGAGAPAASGTGPSPATAALPEGAPRFRGPS